MQWPRVKVFLFSFELINTQGKTDYLNAAKNALAFMLLPLTDGGDF